MNPKNDDELEELVGCEINWHEDKDVTQKKVKKKQKNKSKFASLNHLFLQETKRQELLLN
jgi:hypothetical protein